MRTGWQSESGELELRWAEVGPCESRYAAQNDTEAEQHGSYLKPQPDFASHSPFGGATWFYPDPSVGRTEY